MNNILFKKDGAEELNAQVQRLIAPYLFIICNYEPCVNWMSGEDAKFLIGINNLYRFCIDAGLLNSILKLVKEMFPGKKNEELTKELRQDLKTVNTLRTYFVHNVSAENGQDDIRLYSETWLAKKTGSPDIKHCDYSKAVDALENMAERIYCNSENLIKELGYCEDRKKVIEGWENLIIGFYSKKSGMKILEAQLCNAYLARCKNNSMLGENNIEYGVTIWCRNYYFQKFQDEISTYEKAQKEYTDLLSKKEMLSIKCQIDEIKENRKKKEREIKSNLRRSNVNAENIFRYKNYYILEMSKRYRSFIPKIKEEQLTLLPQELMQYIIEADFKEISLEQRL